ncbi:hypothetical protein ACWPKO_25335 (plasmid) [Coraliomargarita sp. W4R53]
MNIAFLIGGLRRRWYVVVVGFLLAIGLGVGAWISVAPEYERSATQLLLPGEATLPEGNANPYLFLGGLTTAADVIVRAVGSDDVVRELTRDHPDAEVVVSRDPLSSGPSILITVTAPTDTAAGELIAAATARTAAVVDALQQEQDIPQSSQIEVTVVTSDTESTLQQRSRITMVAGAVLGIVLLTLTTAVVIDGLARRVRRRGRTGKTGHAAPPRVIDDEPATQRANDPFEHASHDDDDATELEIDDVQAFEIVSGAKGKHREQP